MDQLKPADQIIQEVQIGGLIALAGAAFLWFGRTLLRILGLPKRMAHLEATSSLMLGAQIPQIDAALLLLAAKCDDEESEEVEDVRKELRGRKKQILDHLTKIGEKVK